VESTLEPGADLHHLLKVFAIWELRTLALVATAIIVWAFGNFGNFFETPQVAIARSI